MDETSTPNPEPETPREERPRAGGILRDWGFDVDVFQRRAKESLDEARGDLTEVGGALRQALNDTKHALVDLQRTKGPVAAELKSGFERAWDEIEKAFGRARQRMREPEQPPSDPRPPSLLE